VGTPSILAAGTTGQVLQASTASTPSWSTPTYPSASGSAGQLIRSNGTNNLYSTSTYPDTNAINTLLYASSANVMAALATANSGVLITSAAGVPSIAAKITAANLPVGSMFNFQQTQLTATTSVTSTSPTMADFGTNLTVSITPTSATNKVLVRAVLSVGTGATTIAYFQLVRGSTAIGIGDAASNRTRCGQAALSGFATVADTTVLEWLDSPATTSSTAYKIQACSANGAIVYLNRSITDTDAATFGRSASVISVCEIVV